ncbi:MFS general substrate transporter [Mollisia scopiformis]|uniref:MFS general substrate transporter n=1 Tax=Mollisia scopiformis TaxID=149040 RepID=A0A132B683_MOLSC|nr:MFS general substrate transporter [Mollisia scopiformis]KUJ07763.1 MFS general substrate transporter [Mollisia scopiformis]
MAQLDTNGKEGEVLHLEKVEAAPIKSSIFTQEDDLGAKRLERRLKWKLDLFILPLVSMVYFFASLGRSDLSNTKISGLDEQLKLSAKDYSNAANMFLVGYVVFQLPGTLLIKKIGPPIQFGIAMFMWGVFTTVSVAMTNRSQLMALRFLIGAAEAFIQGAVFYLSFFYEYSELATRGAIFFSTSTLAGSFSGLISYGVVENLNGAHGWLAWRWIFLIEGVLPVGATLLVIFLLPSTPEKLGRNFKEDERELAIQRSRRAHYEETTKLDWKLIHTPLLSVHFWIFVLLYCASHFCISSLQNFLPAIIKGFGYSGADAQLFSVAVYACAFFGVIFWARVSDCTNRRGWTTAAANVFAVLGYALLLGLTGTKARFGATCLLAFGAFANIALQLTWMTMTFVGYTRRKFSIIGIFSDLRSRPTGIELVLGKDE